MNLSNSRNRFDVLYYKICKQAHTRNLCTLWHNEQIQGYFRQMILWKYTY